MTKKQDADLLGNTASGDAERPPSTPDDDAVESAIQRLGWQRALQCSQRPFCASCWWMVEHVAQSHPSYAEAQSRG